MKTWERRYEDAHPQSKHGDPNAAWKDGLVLVAIDPKGLRWYRRRRWWEFWL